MVVTAPIWPTPLSGAMGRGNTRVDFHTLVYYFMFRFDLQEVHEEVRPTLNMPFVHLQ